ncbi:MAG: DUF5131 family protein [Bryobacteraceae bacterium]
MRAITRRDLRIAERGIPSGPRRRAAGDPRAKDLNYTSSDASVPFFFKQWGGVLKSRTGRILDGRVWDEMPGTELSSGSIDLISISV